MFGPFIGAIPSALLILLVSWQQCVLFLIFIVILQQIDGNIIGPKILGNSTGLSSLYVVVAMLLFGRLFGFIGMIVGVPVTATLYYLVGRIANAALRKRGLSTKTSQYMNKDYPVEY
jgi:predicted PurR-regulated permease PerM